MLALALITGVSPLATDAYLAAFPDMQGTLHVGSAWVQATLTAFVVGFAAGQLISGPLSDSRGRRPFVLVGALGFMGASAACALAPSIWVLLVARVIQGLSGGAGVVAGRGMVTDRFEGTAAEKLLATLFSFLLIGPVIAPVIGGVLVSAAGWRSIFWFTTATGAITLLAVARGLPETLTLTERSASRSPVAEVRRFSALLATPLIRRLLAANSCGSAAIYTYLGSCAFVYERRLGASPTIFGVSFAVSGIVMVGASVVFRRLIGRKPIPTLHYFGALISTAASAVLLVGSTLTSTPLWLVVPIVACALVGNGFTAPATTIRIQHAGRRSAATAAALTGALAYLSGALAAPLISAFGRPTTTLMAALMTTFFAIQLLLISAK